MCVRPGGVKNPPSGSVRAGHTAVQDGGRALRCARGQLRTSRRQSSRASGPAVFVDDSYFRQPSQSSRVPSRSAGRDENVFGLPALYASALRAFWSVEAEEEP